MIRSWKGWIAIICFTSLSCGTLNAADVELSAGGTCTISLRGDIEQGDAKKLEKVIKLTKGNPEYLCLNSNGGSYSEALRLVEVIWSASNARSVGTFVGKNESCLSACAIVFMAGFIDEGDENVTPHRIIHPLAKLGFHAPYIPAKGKVGGEENADRVYQAGASAISKLLKLSAQSSQYEAFFPRDLLAEALSVPREEFRYIETVEDVGRWNIILEEANPPAVIVRGALERACWHKETWFASYYGGSGREDLDLSPSDQRMPIKLKGGYYQEAFYGFGNEALYECFVQIYSTGKNATVLSVGLIESFEKQADWTRVSSEEEFKSAAAEHLKSRVFGGTSHEYDGLHYLYAGDEKISELVVK